jgi:hypothetical protein
MWFNSIQYSTRYMCILDMQTGIELDGIDTLPPPMSPLCD